MISITITFKTQEAFLRKFPIVDGKIDCKGTNLIVLGFNPSLDASIINAGRVLVGSNYWVD